MRYREFKLSLLAESLLSEVSMAPSRLMQWAKSPSAEGMLMGIEFEMYVPNVDVGSGDGSQERDDDMDEEAYDIDQIVDFFSETISRHETRRMHEQYQEWLDEKFSEDYLDDNSNDMDDRIREQLRDDYDLNDEEVNEIMVDRSGRQYDSVYDEVRSEMYNDFVSGVEAEQRRWLRDIGVRYMSDAENEFGLSWPHWKYVGGGEDSIESVADDFSEAIGARVEYSDSYHGVTRKPGVWAVEPDSSLDEPAEGVDGGLEFISPPLPIAEALRGLNLLSTWAKSRGCYTNETTGLHINISVPNFSVETLDYIKLALFMGDQYVLEQFGRIGNTYTKSAVSLIKNNATPDNVKAVMEKMRSHLNTAASKIIHNGMTQKFTSINTREGWVEFRGPGGDYLNKPVDQLVNTALRLAMALRIACDENAHKQEYAKKLYKLIAPSDMAGNTVELFSRYASGNMTKEGLVQMLRRTQQSRQAAKIPPGTKQEWTVYLTQQPMFKMDINARSAEDAIRRAQIHKPEWDRYRDDAFTVIPTGKIIDTVAQANGTRNYVVSHTNGDRVGTVNASTMAQAMDLAAMRYGGTPDMYMVRVA